MTGLVVGIDVVLEYAGMAGIVFSVVAFLFWVGFVVGLEVQLP